MAEALKSCKMIEKAALDFIIYVSNAFKIDM